MPASPAEETPSRRAVVAGPLVALTTLVAALIATGHAGVSFRDPDHVAAKYIVLVGLGVLGLVTVDVWLRAWRRTGTPRPSRAAMGEVRRERWTRGRGLAAGAALISFYVSYLSYGNIKTVVPLLRPGDLFDADLGDIDKAIFFGHVPSEVLHSALGTGFQTQVLSTAYVAFIVFLPLSLGLTLVFSRHLRTGLFLATALSANWLIGAATYVLLPAVGPIYATPAHFASLPASKTTDLQSILLENRMEFLADPSAPGTGQAIAAFVSLHISMTCTAAIAAHLLGLDRRLRIVLWVVVAVTLVDTIYLGWHYVIDDVGGLGVAVAALGLARLLTGLDLAQVRRQRPAT